METVCTTGRFYKAFEHFDDKVKDGFVTFIPSHDQPLIEYKSDIVVRHKDELIWYGKKFTKAMEFFLSGIKPNMSVSLGIWFSAKIKDYNQSNPSTVSELTEMTNLLYNSKKEIKRYFIRKMKECGVHFSTINVQKFVDTNLNDIEICDEIYVSINGITKEVNHE